MDNKLNDYTKYWPLDCILKVESPVQVREVLTGFQCTYLARSLNRILDPINLAFPGKGVPTVGDTESIVRIMISEITAARGDLQLKGLFSYGLSYDGCMRSETS